MLEDLRYLSQKYPNWNYFFVHGKGYNFKQLLSEVENNSQVGQKFIKTCNTSKYT